MKLTTTILARRDGTVRLVDLTGAPLVFKAEEMSGPLVADVTDEATIAHLLISGNFEPADSADFDMASSMVRSSLPDDDIEDEDGDEDDGDEDDVGGLPVESNTPLAPPIKIGKAKKSKQA